MQNELAPGAPEHNPVIGGYIGAVLGVFTARSEIAKMDLPDLQAAYTALINDAVANAAQLREIDSGADPDGFTYHVSRRVALNTVGQEVGGHIFRQAGADGIAQLNQQAKDRHGLEVVANSGFPLINHSLSNRI